MDLKRATAVCLIALFSATLVLLIARALDLQSSARLEGQLTRIADELEALREQGGVGTSRGDAGETLTVYYFHSNTRCASCESIEAQAYRLVHTEYASQLKDSRMAWKVLNYEEPAGKPLAEEFGVSIASVVLAREKDGQVIDSKRLDRLWALVGDEKAFAELLRNAIDAMLQAGRTPPVEKPADNAPTSAKVGEDPPEIPVPVPSDATETRADDEAKFLKFVQENIAAYRTAPAADNP